MISLFFQKKITSFWCIFIVYTSINGLIQCTLVVLVFAGIIFRAFRGFCPKSLKFVPAKYSTLLKPRKLIPAKRTEKNPEFLGIFHPCDKAVRNKKMLINFETICFFLHHLIINRLQLRFLFLFSNRDEDFDEGFGAGFGTYHECPSVLPPSSDQFF